MKDALWLLNWVLTDMVYSAPELAAEKKQDWQEKIDRALKLIEKEKEKAKERAVGSNG